MADGKPVDGSLYVYAPNKVAPICFSIAFAASGLFHVWQCKHYKCFKLMGLHLFCCLMFTVGFACREYGAFNYIKSDDNNDNLNVYIASTLMIYMSPPLLELANFHVLGRVLYYVPYFSPLHPGRVLTTFGALSMLVEVMNALGVSYIANVNVSESRNKLGHTLMKISLILQLIVITLFVLLAGIFQRRSSRGGIKTKRVSAPLLTLYTSTFLILVRCIYRTIEHFAFSGTRAGADPDTFSPLVRYEWYFYVFEASVMLVNSVLWNLRHPRRSLPERSSTYLAQDGSTDLEGPGWKDTRPFVMTLLDPFGWLDVGKEKEQPFWETNGYYAIGKDVV